MNQTLKHISVCIATSILAVLGLYAHDTIILKKCPTDDGHTEPDRGNRIPPRPITSNIDFSTGEITLTGVNSEEILSFELWIEDTCIISTTDSALMLDALQNSDAQYSAIVINMPDCKLIGFYTR